MGAVVLGLSDVESGERRPLGGGDGRYSGCS